MKVHQQIGYKINILYVYFMKIFLALALLFFAFVIQAQSEGRTGNDLLQDCLKWKKMYEHGTSNPNIAYQTG